MNTCVLCNQSLRNNLSLSFIFSRQKIKEKFLCEKCRNKFEKIVSTNSCPGCFRPQSSHDYCKDCKKWQEQYPKTHLNHEALYAYNEIAREYMDQYKFQGDLLLANIFSDDLHECLNKYQKEYLITPIPLNTHSKQKRGFNQVELLLEKAEISYIPFLENVRHEASQSSKNRSERLKTPQPFQLINQNTLQKSLKNKLLIVDDVYTTGRTILHARLLFETALSDPYEIKTFSLFR